MEIKLDMVRKRVADSLIDVMESVANTIRNYENSITTEDEEDMRVSIDGLRSNIGVLCAIYDPDYEGDINELNVSIPWMEDLLTEDKEELR